MKKKILLFFFVVIVSVILINLLFNNQRYFDENCNVSVHRFEQDFFSIQPDSFDIFFPIIKASYPSFFHDTTLDFKHDVLLDDTLNMILDSVQSLFQFRFPNLKKIETGFCNYKKYFPSDSFSIYTYIDGAFDYRYPVVFADQKLFISLDLFLGESHSFYSAFPEYIKFSHDTTYLPSTCFITLAGRHIPPPRLNNFLSSILYYSKAYFFAQHMLVDVPDYHLFKCAEEKIIWCKNNEKVIWEYMIENDYLFSSSPELIERFISLAPFSKFGLDIDRNSPGSVGVWLGLQILNAYADNNNVSFIDVLNETDYIKILNKSGYKP
jgi:hypothetical protein